MKKLFISSPMNGKTNEEIMEARNRAINLAERELKEPVEVIESFVPNATDPPLKCLARALELMADADIVVFTKGWSTARECFIEHECAEKYSLGVIITDGR